MNPDESNQPQPGQSVAPSTSPEVAPATNPAMTPPTDPATPPASSMPTPGAAATTPQPMDSNPMSADVTPPVAAPQPVNPVATVAGEHKKAPIGLVILGLVLLAAAVAAYILL